jgi:hypothetical protein
MGFCGFAPNSYWILNKQLSSPTLSIVYKSRNLNPVKLTNILIGYLLNLLNSVSRISTVSSPPTWLGPEFGLLHPVYLLLKTRLDDGGLGSRLWGYHPVAPRPLRYGPFVHRF